MSHLHESVNFESTLQLKSVAYPSVTYRICRPSFRRRSALIEQVRELGRSLQFLEASESVTDKIEVFHLHSKIDQLYLEWGLDEIAGIQIDGEEVTVDLLLSRGPESLTREILEQIKRQCTVTESERKN